MKIITDNVAYVQNYDLGYIMMNLDTVPDYIYLKIFNNNEPFFAIDENRFDFFKFENKEEIEYFKNLDFIIDIFDYNNTTTKKIYEDGKKINETKNEIILEYNKLLDMAKSGNDDSIINELLIAYNNIEYKFNSLRDTLWYKQQNLKFDLPVPFDEKEVFLTDIKEEQESNHSSSAEKISIIQRIKNFLIK